MKISPLTSSCSVVSKTVKNKTVSNPVKNTAVLMSTAAASAIAASAMVKNSSGVSVEEIKSELLKRNYKIDDEGNFIKKIAKKDTEKINKKYSHMADCYRYMMLKPIDDKKLNDFKDFINIDKVSGKKLFNEHFDNLLFTYLVLSRNDCYEKFLEAAKKNKAYYGFIENLVKNDLSGKQVTSFCSYKVDNSSSMNYELREKAINPKHEILTGVNEKIKEISSYIDTQKITKPVKLYRGEYFNSLNDGVSVNGKDVKLGKMLEQAAKSKSEKQINKIKNFIENNDVTKTQNGFLSLSVNRSVGERYSKNALIWEIEPEKNSKGVYVEGLNLFGVFSDENEVLMQKNSQIKIKSAEYDKDNNVWLLKATVSN